MYDLAPILQSAERLAAVAVCIYLALGSLGFVGRARDHVLDRIVNAVAGRRIRAVSANRADAWLARRFGRDASPMLRGGNEGRLAYARRAWPERQWPTLYMDVPADVRRPLTWDGRLLGGIAVTWLAWRHVTPEVAAQQAQAAIRAGLRAGLALTLACIAASLYRIGLGFRLPYPAWADGLSWLPGIEWYVLAAVAKLLAATSAIVMSVLAGLAFAPAAGFFAYWRNIKGWWATAGEALATPTRDSLVIYKHRSDIRDVEYRAYVRQARDAAGRLAAQPVIRVGTGTGVFRARGDMEAPSSGQPVCLDGESIRQHALVLGGTGSGKTRLVMRPLFRRIMGADWGPSHRIGAYVTDGKGTLWKDLQGIPELDGRDDVRVVGTGKNQLGVNLLAGMTPLEVSTTLKAVSGQVMGSSSGSDFWSESASLLVLHAATLARALDLDDEVETAAEWSDARPWSLVGLARLATDARRTTAALARLAYLRELPQDCIPPSLAAALDDEELEASETWMTGTWGTMPNETRGGIVANVNVVLGKLAGAGELRERFCTGKWPQDDCTDVGHALTGGVLLIAVGETQWGMVGKVVSVWLKTRLYIQARRLLEQGESRQAVSCALFADEWQMLATTGQDSDATFWNVARETGVFLVAATQSLAALEQALGKDATSNIVNLLRTKIVLKTEELSTLDYCTKLAGETLRGLVVSERFYETQGQREIERPDVAPGPAEPRRGFVSILPTRIAMGTPGMAGAAVVDRRFVPRMLRRNADAGQAFSREGEIRSAEQAAYWRQEDQEREARGNGLSWRPKVTSDELLLGEGFAFAVVQRAGGDRTDIIDLHMPEDEFA